MAADRITAILQEILTWMDAHDDVLPKLHIAPTPDQRAEASLRNRYRKHLAQHCKLTRAQSKLQQEIDWRKTEQVDLDNLELIQEWAAKHSGRLPLWSKDDTEQNA